MKITRLATIAAAAAMLSGAASASDDSAASIRGKWRITIGAIAPWSDEAEAGATPLLVGETVRFNALSVKGPQPIGCGGARYEATDVPPEGLFQGGLPPPAGDALPALGLSGATFRGVSVSCDTGVFEYHWADPDTLLVALDNRIWTLDRTPGTSAAKSSPEGAVQRFLEAHFAGDMGFSVLSMSAKRASFTKALQSKIDAYFALTQDPNEAPLIDGDPFTDSQDYPARFAVGGDDKKSPGVLVPVEFADAFRRKTVVFEMAREKGRWLINDLKYESGETLSTLLAP